MRKLLQTNYTKGLWAETLAATYLRMKGYRILKHRYLSPLGEIDLIARKPHKISFIEVKARGSFEDALTSLTYKQQQRIGRSAMQWISFNPQFSDFDISFDMVLVIPKHFPRHLQNAFEYQH